MHDYLVIPRRWTVAPNWAAVCCHTLSPLSSCLISRLACVVVNWLTMSRAVWLRVFLTPALMPLWVEVEKMCNSQLGHSGHSVHANMESRTEMLCMSALMEHSNASRCRVGQCNTVLRFETWSAEESEAALTTVAFVNRRTARRVTEGAGDSHPAADALPLSSHRGLPDAALCRTQTVCLYQYRPESATCSTE